jgi:hypothetical protein
MDYYLLYISIALFNLMGNNMILGNDLYTVVDCDKEYEIVAVYSTVLQCRAFCEALLSVQHRSLAIKSIASDKVTTSFNLN